MADGMYRGQVLALQLTSAPIVGLRLLGNTHHHLNRLERISTRGCFRTEHEGIRPIENGIGAITGLRSCWTGMRNHGLEHLRRGTDRQPTITASSDVALLTARYFLCGPPHAPVASGDHRAIPH